MLLQNKVICLFLNSYWQPIGYKSVKETMSDFCGCDFQNKNNVKSIDFEYELDENNSPIFSKLKHMESKSWEEWLKLPIRDWDLYINTPHKKIRVPTVLIITDYKDMPIKEYNHRPSKYDIYLRDQGICQYTNKKINKKDGTIDHIIPKSKGGGNFWNNMVFCSKNINLKKANKNLKDLNINLIKEPTKPKSTPICNLIKYPLHHTWNHFIKK